jgi:hypothetical protein
MGVADWFRSLLGSSDATPADDPVLAGTSEQALSSSLDRLRPGERGWLPLADAARLFSTEDSQYAFGQMDEAGMKRLAEFAAEHRCTPDFRPTVARMYFRKSG